MNGYLDSELSEVRLFKRMKKKLCTIKSQLTLSGHRPWSTENKSSSRGYFGFEKAHLCFCITLLSILSAPPKLDYLCVNSTLEEKIQ